MITTALISLVGLGGVGAVLILSVAMIKMRQGKRQDLYRRTYLANFPRDIPHESVLNFMRALSGLPRPRPFKAVDTVVFDTYADVEGIKHYLSIPGHVVADVEGLFRTHIAGGSLLHIEDDRVVSTPWEQVTELGTTSAYIPLRIGSPEAVAATLLSGFSPLKPTDAVCMQWVISPSHPQAPPKPDKTRWPMPDADYSRAKDKFAEPTFLAVGRLASKGADSRTLIRRLYTGLSSTHVHGMHFRRRFVPGRVTLRRLRHRRGALVYSAVLNAHELSVLAGFPFGAPNVAGLPRGRSRHLAPDHMIPASGGVSIGTSSFPGLEKRGIVIPFTGLMQHEWVLGPTGSGKSTLLHNQAAQIMEAGHGLILIEPKGDLARDVLASVPKERINDVVWFDPTDTHHPIGLNVLASTDPERTAGHIVSLFKGLYGESWGPRLEQILRYSVLTAALNGLTLYDVKQLLVNPEFRSRIVRATKDADAKQFWRKYMGDEKYQSDFDSVINKLDAFVGFRAIRNIVGQTRGLNMQAIVRDRKILLVPLPAGELGEANASMLGSLLVDQLWQAVRLRPQHDRPPLVLMLDEFQNFLNLPVALEDTFAQSRSYGLGLVVANQHTGQLTNSILAAIKANARSKVVFAMGPDDAKKLKDDFLPLAAQDLQTLTQYEVACNVMTASGSAPTATAHTSPPPPSTGLSQTVQNASKSKYGRPVKDIEDEWKTRHNNYQEERKKPAIGRVDPT